VGHTIAKKETRTAFPIRYSDGIGPCETHAVAAVEEKPLAQYVFAFLLFLCVRW
jgi:hypothetical protein